MLKDEELVKPLRPKGKRVAKIPRGTGNEAKRVSIRLNGFNYEESEVYKTLKRYFSSGVTHNELKSIAQVICINTHLKLDRDATRDNRVLIKWFDENWEICEGMLQKIKTKDINQIVIDSTREKDYCNFDNS